MIIDHIKNFSQYRHLHPLMPRLEKFLSGTKLEALPTGRTDIDGDQLYVGVSRYKELRDKPPVLECHKTYWDIQFVVEGEGILRWKSLQNCTQIKTPYDSEKDLFLLDDAHDLESPWSADYFLILMPQDAHSTFAKTPSFGKAVVKLKIDAP